MDTVFLKVVVHSRIAGYTDTWCSTKRHRDELVHDGNLGRTFIAANDRVGHGER